MLNDGADLFGIGYREKKEGSPVRNCICSAFFTTKTGEPNESGDDVEL